MSILPSLDRPSAPTPQHSAGSACPYRGCTVSRGPFADGTYAAVVGMRINKGTTLEQALKKHIPGLPKEVAGMVEFDAARVGGVGVVAGAHHREHSVGVAQ